MPAAVIEMVSVAVNLSAGSGTEYLRFQVVKGYCAGSQQMVNVCGLYV